MQYHVALIFIRMYFRSISLCQMEPTAKLDQNEGFLGNESKASTNVPADSIVGHLIVYNFLNDVCDNQIVTLRFKKLNL